MSKVKISFYDEPEFYVNEKKGVVTCKIRGIIQLPFLHVYNGLIDVQEEMIEGIGVAKCSGNDKFDVNRGKRIALAKAENKAYKTAMNRSREVLIKLHGLIHSYEEMIRKGDRVIEHNNSYVETLSEVNSIFYRKEVLPPKRGVTIKTK